jgi:PAS domain S-box-containing protein
MHEADGGIANDMLLETILRILPEGLFICDANGRVVRANDAALRITGHTAETVLEQNLLDPEWNHLADDDEESRYAEGDGPLVGAIKGGKACVNSAIKLKVKEAERILSVSSSRIQSLVGDTVGAIAIIRDITEERQNGKMEREFLSLLAHELRAPLTVISGYAQLLGRRLTKKGLDDEADSVELIEKQVSRLSGMIADLLDTRQLDESYAVLVRKQSQVSGHTAPAATHDVEQSSNQ